MNVSAKDGDAFGKTTMRDGTTWKKSRNRIPPIPAAIHRFRPDDVFAVCRVGADRSLDASRVDLVRPIAPGVVRPDSTPFVSGVDLMFSDLHLGQVFLTNIQ